MSIVKKKFGEIDGVNVDSYILDNERGLMAEIITYGGAVRRLVFDGTDVVLGRENIESYSKAEGYFGALVGRNSNRIEGCSFALNGKEYKLAANDMGRNNNLHGGPGGFSYRVWNAEPVDGIEPKLVLSLFSKDGEEGFPGNLNVTVTYVLTLQNSIKIIYNAESDADTIVNMTNHSYFNLNGHSSGDIKNHTLLMDCGFYTPINEDIVPDGTVLSVAGTPFDFTVEKKIGDGLACSDPQLETALGFDHNFVINGSGFRKFAEVRGDVSNIVMEVFTDLPAVQFYTGNYVGDDFPCKDVAEYSQYQGLCLETQVFPNAMKYPFFPSPILKKGEMYNTVTEYKFSKK